MRDDRVLGELTEEDVAQSRSALQTAGHAWDVRAATLSSRAPNGRADADGDQLADVIRGGPWRPEGKAPAGAPDLSYGRGDPGSQDGAEFLDDLFARRIMELLFIEFTPDEVNVIKVAVGEGGLPRQADAGSMQWPSLAPMIDSRDRIRRFQLAGGIGTLPPVSRRQFDTTVLHWLKAYIPPSYEQSVVLLTPRTGWVLLERAAAAVRTAYTLRAELGRGSAVDADGTTSQAVREVLRTAPLLADHTLVLARADRSTGAVLTHSHVLFPAGRRLRRGETAVADVTVHGGVTGAEPVRLPVFAGRPAADGTGAEPLTVHEVTVAALSQVRLRFVLRGPGEVELVTPQEGSAHAPRRPAAVDVPALLTRLPHRILRPPRLEVFLTVELSGADRDETQERLAFARDLLTTLSGQDASGAAIRTGAIGHYDHEIHENGYTSRRTLLLPPVPAGPAPAALTALAGWRPARREQDMASSLEDALRAVLLLVGAATGSSEDVRRVLLIVARRPPGQPRQHGIIPACPLGADWRAELGRLRSAGVKVMTRADPQTGPPPQDHPGIAARRYTDAAWAELSAEGTFRPGQDSAADVAQALVPPWRLEGPPCRLAFATPLL
ncbi:hypothetical protein ADK65_07615 [Streptomyces sp. NRRL B-1140]|nr:hypothetical protein ADK65_07615 [Streptomyces sp. NRRL B-1140]